MDNENANITNIFVKKKDINKDKNKNNKNKQKTKEIKILQKKEILSSIPKNAIEHENKTLQNEKTEYRWRILNIEEIENEIIEISIKEPNKNRLFMTQSGIWKEYDNNNFDKYVVKSYYYYE